MRKPVVVKRRGNATQAEVEAVQAFAHVLAERRHRAGHPTTIDLIDAAHKLSGAGIKVAITLTADGVVLK